jgi:Meiotically up-regulated gene 113
MGYRLKYITPTPEDLEAAKAELQKITQEIIDSIRFDIGCAWKHGDRSSALKLVNARLRDLASVVSRALYGRFPRKRTVKCHVYLIRSSDGLYKIGRAINPEDRLKMLQTSTGLALRLEYSRDLRSKGKPTERHLHSTYLSKRVRGEWFALDASDVEAVKAYIREVRR